LRQRLEATRGVAGLFAAGSADALYRQRRIAGLFGDQPILFFDHGARGSVAVKAAEDLHWNAAIGSLGTIFVKHVE
jgi:hypothetical protein